MSETLRANNEKRRKERLLSDSNIDPFLGRLVAFANKFNLELGLTLNVGGLLFPAM